MKTVGVSMRIVRSEYEEHRDAVSHDLINYVHRQGYEPILIPNIPELCASYIHRVDLLILSGGDDLLSQSAIVESDDPRALRDRAERILLAGAIAERKPVLGICRGAQLVNTYFGGTCARIESPKRHVAVEHEVHITSERLRSFFDMKEYMVVNSYHQLGIQSVASELVVAATAGDGEIEAVEHNSLCITGLMWHPERACSDLNYARLHGELISRFLTLRSWE